MRLSLVWWNEDAGHTALVCSGLARHAARAEATLSYDTSKLQFAVSRRVVLASTKRGAVYDGAPGWETGSAASHRSVEALWSRHRATRHRRLGTDGVQGPDPLAYFCDLERL